jgi:hypothetical protein
MATSQNAIPNEMQLSRFYGGTEVQLGTLVAPTFKFYGDLALNKARPLVDRNEFAGTRFKDYTPVRGPIVVDGTYAQPLTYEDLAILLRYGMVGGVTPTDDGNTTHGYTYAYSPSSTRFDIDFMSGETGFPGMPFTFTGLHFPEFTISGDIDDSEAAWKWASKIMALTKDLKAFTSGTATGGSTSTVIKAAAGWTVNQFQGGFVRMLTGTVGNVGQVREIASNDATTLTIRGLFPSAVVNTDTFSISGVFTAGISDRTRETIDVPGTVVYMDAQGSIGTTLVNGRVISFGATFASNSFGKRFMENTTGYSRYGFGAFVVTGQVRVEFDRRDEYDNWVNSTATAIRIQKTGTTIDSGAGTTKLARIDIPDAQWDAFPMDNRNGNITATITFRGYVDPSLSYPGGITIKNKLSVLP